MPNFIEKRKARVAGSDRRQECSIRLAYIFIVDDKEITVLLDPFFFIASTDKVEADGAHSFMS